MAGVGVLGMPAATADSGWLGLVLLIVTAFICMITANLLGSIMMRMPQSSIRDYPSVGGAAFGRFGFMFCNVMQYTTLAGVTVIFMLLAGNFLNAIFCTIPARLFTIMVGIVLAIFLIIVPQMKEAKVFAYLGVATTFLATILACVLSVLYYSDGPCVSGNAPISISSVCSTCQHDLILATIGTGFSVFSFAFGGHASIPNFVLEMRHPRHFYKTTAVVFPVALFLLYMPMAALGYLAYGRGLDEAHNTILDAIIFFDPGQRAAIIATNAILIVHLIVALPIITVRCIINQSLIFH